MSQSKSFTSSNGKTFTLFPSIPLPQYRFIIDSAKDIAGLKARLREKTTNRVVAFRYDLQRMQVVQHKITVFQLVRAPKQAGAAHLYKSALASMINAANEVLAEMGQAELLAEQPAVAATA